MLCQVVLGLTLTATSVPTPALVCDVVPPNDMDAPWQDATRGVRLWLEGREDVDCGHVELRPEGSGARVVFTTTDGRRAERLARTPEEVLPVVQALATTIPEEAPKEAPERADTSATTHLASVRASAEGTTPAAPALPPGVLLEARAGLRMPGPVPCSASSGPRECTFALVSLGLGVGVHVNSWELGIAVAVEPTYTTLSGVSPTGLTMTSYSAGVSAARHTRAGNLDIVLGSAAGVLLTHAMNEGADETPTAQDRDTFSQVEPRIGIFAGLAVPSTATIRFRPVLALDVIPTHLGQSWTAPNAPLPGLAWWTASASLGVQWRAP